MNEETIAALFLSALALYAAAGLVFAIAFAARGAMRLDQAALGMPVSARLLILPGAAALWPWLLPRWRRARPEEGR